ncbi:MAG: DUF72 domain-containing protein [Rubrobacteraceae bacterium]
MVRSSAYENLDSYPQQRLFEETPGEIEPPEPGLYLGTSGWSYADWEGSVYPENLPAASRLAEYVKDYATVEIDSTFYGTPRRQTVERWRQVAPEGFLFAAKFPREITHEKGLVSCERQAETFVRTMEHLGEKLGPLLLQLPPSFPAGEIETLDRFLSALPGGFRYAVEVRHRSWVRSGLPDLLRERKAALVLVDYPRMPRLQEATTDFSYIRWLGDRNEFPSGHTHPKKDRQDDLRWWSGVVDEFLREDKTVFAYANNHYQNHSPSTLEQFLEIRGGGG